MFGLLDRLEYWLRQGALNQLDPEGEPLHPPALYADLKVGKRFIPRANAPTFESDFWLGFARIVDHPNYVEITEWFDLNSIPTDTSCAMTLLFGSPLPWEYPKKVDELFRECERHGVAKEFLFKILKAGASLTPAGQPLYMILGAPMRGIAGGSRKQHLSIWAIEEKDLESIRLTIGKDYDSADLAKMREEFEELLIRVFGTMSISWCPVLEARPEVTVRRDEHSHVSFFRNKSISIWGCGALGSPIAIHLCRAGVRRLVLRDKGIVTPGVLVRQPYFKDDVCSPKVDALKTQLHQIRPELEVEALSSDIETLLTPEEIWNDGTDLVIDATASDVVRRRLEIIWNSSSRVPVASLMWDRTATRLITAVVNPEFSGGTWDVLRKAKLAILQDTSLISYADSFFPAEISERPFQPEPGCSEPTFVGSAADSAALAAIGLNMIAEQMADLKVQSAISTLFEQPTTSENTSFPPSTVEFVSDFVLLMADHQVRISPSAMKEIQVWVSQNRRIRNREVETGGLLWGEWDDATGVVWVTEASGPPPDSQHSAEHFVCGVVGTKEEHDARVRQTRRSVGYIGMWHTHPTSRPLPSDTDFAGMHNILTAGDLPPRKNLLLIFGRESGHDTVGAFLFRRLKGDATAAIHNLLEGRKRLPWNIL
jgi:integrative and conjugative element protein (TIGR02256 family)